jgi:regulator of RNase E activity RraA
MTTSDLALLAKYDTPTVCNVIELFKVRPQTAGYMDSRIRALYPSLPPMVGYASTATFRSAFAPASGRQYGSLESQMAALLELPGPGVVVFQDIDSPVAAATFGEVMCTSYKSFGAAGLITSGAGRDYEQLKPLQFPVFCEGLNVSHGYPQILDLHVPVHVGGIVVHPGDLLHGDANGVTTIPLDIASEVAHVCAEFVAAEDILIGYCRAGNVTVQGYTDARKALSAKIKELGERVRGAE